MKILSQYRLRDNEPRDVDQWQLVGIRTAGVSYLTSGQVETLSERVDELEIIVGRLLERIAKDDQDALELAGLEHTYKVIP